MSRELCSNYSVFRNHLATDDKSKIGPMSRGVGVVSFDTSQLDCAQQCGKGDAYKCLANPLDQNIDAGTHYVESKENQDIPNQYWNIGNGNYNGLYQATANVEPYGNPQSYPPPSFGANNEAQNCSPYWRKRLSKGAKSLSSSEQRYYHGGYEIHPESHQYHQYQSCGPKYHPVYQPHPIISIPTQAQHHFAPGPCYHQSPYHEGTNQEPNGAFERVGNIDTSDREIEQIYPLTPPYHPHPTQPLNRSYAQPPPNVHGMNYNNPNVEHYPNHYGPVSRKRKHEDVSCAHEKSTEYMVYTDRCMSPLSDISVSSVASEQEDHFCQTANNNLLVQQTVSVPIIDKRQDISAHRVSNVMGERPSKCEKQLSMEVPRIERGESYYPFFNFDKNRIALRTVTPTKVNTHIPQEGGRDEYHEY